MTKNNIIWLVLMVVIFAGATFLLETSPGDNKDVATQPLATNTTQVSTTTTMVGNANIHIDNLKADALINSPLKITGEAKLWYFEASFPIRLLDGNGKLVATGIAQAQGDWMTAEFVPFISEITFLAPGTATGTLVFEKDNPSGLPEFDQSFSLPIRFVQNDNL